MGYLTCRSIFGDEVSDDNALEFNGAASQLHCTDVLAAAMIVDSSITTCFGRCDGEDMQWQWKDRLH